MAGIMWGSLSRLPAQARKPAPRLFRRLLSRGSRGQSLVELALVLMILVLILAGLADLGRALNTYIVITNAAREGARYGAGHPTEQAAIRARVIAEAAGSGIDLSGSTINISASVSGQPVKVSVTYDLALLFIGLISGGSSIQVSSAVTMIAF